MHTAPAHGPEDYDIAKKYNIPIVRINKTRYNRISQNLNIFFIEEIYYVYVFRNVE